MAKIIVADDEMLIRRLVCDFLIKEGHTPLEAADGKIAVELFNQNPDTALIIMDIMMPVLSGIEVLKKMRSKDDTTPVLLLTAKDSIKDKVKGLDIGADDYMIKPFAFDELLARIRVMTRKAVGQTKNIFTVGELKVDTNSRTVTRSDKEIPLSAKEYEILEYMVRNKGTILSREKIENHVWNFDYSGGTNVIDVYIRYLRKKIDDGYDTKLIHTVRGMGYVIRCDL